MHDEERKIRGLLDAWWRATEAGDVDGVLALMADDVVFLTPGGEPFGKAEFENGMRGRSFQVEGGSDIEELQVAGTWAWMRTHINVTMTPPDGQPLHRAGYTRTIRRTAPAGRWVVARDANLLSAEHLRAPVGTQAAGDRRSREADLATTVPRSPPERPPTVSDLRP